MKQIAIALLGIAIGTASAEPTPLVDAKVFKSQSSKSYIRSVHEEIATGTRDIGQIRYRILEGMIKTHGRLWTYEGEGDGYILARFEYRGHTIIMRVEYDEQLVQLKYHAGSEAYACDGFLLEGVCFKNHKGYYNYTKNFRESLKLQFEGSEQST